MNTKSIAWNTGSGNINVEYGGSKDGTIIVTSDNNNLYESRSQQIKVKTTDGSNIERTITIQQAAKVRTNISSAIVTAPTQTYSGVAKTPTVTVTLNGDVVPSSSYDVAYSNNTNAGTATITVTGKNDYTGTATGTFTIEKANPTYTAPTANSLTYNGNSCYLTTTGSTNDGTVQYSENGSYWSTTRVTKTTAGTYTTYWRLVGDANHNDVASTSISTTINKASRTISFADSYVVLNTSSNVTKTATPSAGSGDGAITYSISSTTYATINSSSGKVTSKTSDGSAVVTATIAEGTNYLSASASYNLYVFATTHNYDYNGSYRSVTLPPGTYQFQCWGAQGGSNAAAPTYGITAQAGGKGGYSIGQLTIAQATTIRVYVGGAGSSSSGGYNGGGNTTTSSTRNADDIYGTSRMGGGGGGTDIRLSDGSLYSRIIVAGGGSGGAMFYKRYKTTIPTTISKSSFPETRYSIWNDGGVIKWGVNPIGSWGSYIIDISAYRGYNCAFTVNTATSWAFTKNVEDMATVEFAGNQTEIYWSESCNQTIPSDANYLYINSGINYERIPSDITLTTTGLAEKNESQVGFFGGGVEGGHSGTHTYSGKQNSAGEGASFGAGRAITATQTRYCGGGGGGGWYGGGCSSSNDYEYGLNCSGGGSGWVNTSASASNRPSGYTGLQLDSGTTYTGNTSFPSTSGGNETGHSGNGYARITRLS